MKKSKCIRLFAVADWMALHHGLGFARPNSTKRSDVCFLCNWQKKQAAGEFLSDDVFNVAAIPDEILNQKFKNSSLPFILRNVRYDPMHGFARLVSLILNNLEETITASQVQQLKQLILTKCKQSKKGINLHKIPPFLAKAIFSDLDLLEEMASIFADSTLIPPTNLFGQFPINWDKAECARNLFLSLHALLKFVYCDAPDDEDIRNVDCARQVIIACLVQNNFELHPASHYMLTHFFYFFLLDGTSSFFLNEGSESFVRWIRDNFRLGGAKQEVSALRNISVSQNLRLASRRRRRQTPKRRPATSHRVPLILASFLETDWVARARNARRNF
jgi:hypothetical protein